MKKFPRIRVALPDLGIPRFQSTPRVNSQADYDRCLAILERLVTERDTATLRAIMQRRIRWSELLFAETERERVSLANDRLREKAASIAAPRDRANSLLYFLRNPATGAIKIGVALSVEQRVHDLEPACGVRLEILRVVEQGRALERALHRIFAGSRQVGEWFQPSAGLLAAIAATDLPEWVRAWSNDDSDSQCGESAEAGNTLSGNEVQPAPRVGLEPTTTRLTGSCPFGSVGHVDPKGSSGGGEGEQVNTESTPLGSAGGSEAGQSGSDPSQDDAGGSEDEPPSSAADDDQWIIVGRGIQALGGLGFRVVLEQDWFGNWNCRIAKRDKVLAESSGWSARVLTAFRTATVGLAECGGPEVKV